MFSRCLKNQPVFTEEGDGDSVLARSFLRDQNIENMLTVSNENAIWISSENTAGSLKDGSHYLFGRQECGKCSLQECFDEALLFFELLNAKKLFGNYSLRDQLSFFCY